MLAPMTSTSHPIRVDWLPRMGKSGRLGLTFAPGKHQVSVYGQGIWARDLGLDLRRLRKVLRVDVLVCLLEDLEFGRLGIPGYLAETRKRGLEVIRLPIRDGGVPLETLARALVRKIDRLVTEGKRVVIHCAGGLGRAMERGKVPASWFCEREVRKKRTRA